LRPEVPISLGVRDNVDVRLLGRFQQSWARQDAARRLLPAKWLTDTRPAAQELNELFLDLLESARGRVEQERAALGERRASVADLGD
jgi:hypothetical protein